MKNFGIIGVFLILGVLVLNFLVGGMCTEYLIEFWASHIKGHAINVPFFPCALISIFVAEFTIPAAIITWIISFII